MASVNVVILLGTLGEDPDLKYSQQGLPYSKFSLATSDYGGKDENGKPIYKTEWHNIMVTGEQAKAVQKHLKKGDMAHITGKKQTTEWNDQQGNRRSKCEIISRDVKFIPKNYQGQVEYHEGGNYSTYQP